VHLEHAAHALAVALGVAVGGCPYAGFFAYKSQGGGTEAALGEEHQMNYPAHDSFLLAQDALRGAGILFEVDETGSSLQTLWQKADNPPGILPSLVGVEPRYRYEIRAMPEGPAKSKLIVNLRAEDVPDSDLERYKASTRLDLFNKIDQLASITPPPSNLPRSGGVNFALLPNEDLKALAKRVTGSADNWEQIAKDNGLSQPGDAAPLQTIWVRSDLLKQAPKTPSGGDSLAK
jgi:hypothetical protein